MMNAIPAPVLTVALVAVVFSMSSRNMTALPW